MHQTSVRPVHVPSEPDSSYFLRVDWSGRGLGCGFELLLTDGQNAWRGDVSEAAVCREAEELEMQPERYIQDLQQALTGTEKSTNYSFVLTPSPPNSSSAVTLAYEKVQRDISFRMGSVLLKAIPEPTEAVRELLVHSLQRGNALERHNSKLEEENQRLIEEHQRITAELKHYAGDKEALEAELYSRFVLVLNEKKAKIRSLQQNITRLQEASADKQQKKDSVKCDQSAGQEQDEYGGSTDEEPGDARETAASASLPPEASAEGPLDDSLKDITDVAPCRKRRFRHVPAPQPEVKRPQRPQKRRSSIVRGRRRSRK
ncbi:DNA repair protein XRCC4 isoform X2 [Takifugu flavidus]|uniref:DNA repair protein XRCC4 isoform X2 n=1 Tax=Takifugu flavidus TaxID=433684 RepID=UPI0025440E18|nr:DNA repair protein XRCC4 isoform X2 [Takifugu flavidus]